MEVAASELRERTRARQGQEGGHTSALTFLETDSGGIEIEITEPIITFAQKLQRAETQDVAAEALAQADAKLDAWNHTKRGDGREHEGVTLLCGVEMRFSQERG
jgi:hypothetical protein